MRCTNLTAVPNGQQLLMNQRPANACLQFTQHRHEALSELQEQLHAQQAQAEQQYAELLASYTELDRRFEARWVLKAGRSAQTCTHAHPLPPLI